MADAWIYRAALWCDDCAQQVVECLDAQEREDTGDSDDYPQGPESDGGGEADTPQHCEGCGCHLENPLTDDGVEYVRGAVAENCGLVVQLWAEFYADDLRTEVA